MHRFAFLLVAFGAIHVTAACSDPPEDGPDEPPGDTSFQRFAAFDRWEIHYTYEQNTPESFIEDGHTKWYLGATVTQTNRQSVDGTIPLVVESVDEEFVKLTGVGPVSASLDERWTSVAEHHYESRYDYGRGTALDGVDVVLELELGRYDVSFHAGDFPSSYGGVHGDVHDPIVYSATSTTHLGYPYHHSYEDRPNLPDAGLVLAGSRTWEQYWAGVARAEPDTNLERRYRVSARSGTLRWTLEPSDPIDVELVLEPMDYDDFIPRGGANEAAIGNAMPVRAFLRAKDGGAPRLHAASIRFDLVDVSREPGVSLNDPVAGARTTPDLAFPDAQPTGATVSMEGQHAEIAGTDDATVLVGSYDWGAHGALRVTAVLTNGLVVVGRLEGADAFDTRLLIPKRAPDSRIADAWRQLVDFSGPDTEDTDFQVGNPNAGDGLSAYEEYRGMRVRGMHSRQQTAIGGGPLLRPRFKDLVVENHLGDDARRGLARFQASTITVVPLAAGELPESRLVNVNRASASLGEQYGLRLVTGDLPDGVSGENRPIDLLGKTPKRSTLVIVDPAGMAESFADQAAEAAQAGIPMPYTLSDEIANTIAHEIAHGVGAPHHGRPTAYAGHRVITSAMTSWHAYGVDGIEITRRPLELEGAVGRPGNDASGDAGCIMAYTNFYTWAAINTFEPYAFYMTGVQPLGEHFCVSGDPTGMNVPHAAHGGVEVPGFFGASSGGCLGAMRVRDF